MAFIEMRVQSQALRKATAVRMAFHEGFRGPYAVVLLLHGLSDDESIWTRRSSLERYTERWPFLVVMPDGARSFYCDSALGAYETFLVKELVPLVDRLFATRAQRRYRAVGGLSMGGYGSMKLGLKFPQLFGAVASHSSAFGFAHGNPEPLEQIPEVRLIMESLDREANDVHALAAVCPKRQRPKLYFDCGRDDFLLADNEAFHRHLQRLKYPHTYRRFAGGHAWAYWDEHIQDAFAFLGKAMGVRPRG